MKTHYTLKFSEYSPVSHKSSYLHTKFDQINSFIDKKFRRELSGILLKPYKKLDEVTFRSEESQEYKLLEEFDEETKKHLLVQYNAIVEYVGRKCKSLQSSEDPDHQEWAAILQRTFDMNHNIILSDGKNLRLVWGWVFDLKESYILPFEAFSGSLIDLETTIEENSDTVVNGNQEIKGLHKESLEEDFTADLSVEQADQSESDEEVEKDAHHANQVSSNNVKPPNKKNWFLSALEWVERFFKKFWWLIILLLGLVFLLLALNDCEGSTVQAKDMKDSELKRVYQEIIPPTPRKRTKPVKPEDIIDDEDSYSKVVGNVVNIALKKKSDNFKLFAVDLKSQFKDDEYSIVYYDDETRRLQLQFPIEQRKKIKNAIRKKLSSYELLIWDESIFNYERTMNDPSFHSPDKSWHFDKIGAEEAWNITIGDPSVVIAVIDDGFDLNHVELKGKIHKPYNVINHDTIITYNGKLIHGTHVAGLALANGNNGTGISGIAPGCRLMPIQAGSEIGFTSTDVIDGILYAIKNDADIINMSLGKSFRAIGGYNAEDLRKLLPKIGQDEALFWEEIFKMANDNNVTIVLAGGNDNVLIGLDPLTRSDNVIRVMAMERNDKKSHFSNYFYSVPNNGSGVSAPGVNLYSCVPSNNYSFMSGTSMACPIVAGCIGLIKSVDPEISNKEIMRLLNTTSKETGKTGEAPIIQIDQILNEMVK
ncbi:MAG: hypothetical protein DCO96_03740 [Fluviicola sp. XM-24bin1]|nr:MAG: hypothetical protein DCO96_03740 [Fluviicola sp. XM-24bin1]